MSRGWPTRPSGSAAARYDGAGLHRGDQARRGRRVRRVPGLAHSALDLDIAAGLLVVPDLPWLRARRTFQLVRHPRKLLSRAAAAFHALLLTHRDAEQGVI